MPSSAGGPLGGPPFYSPRARRGLLAAAVAGLVFLAPGAIAKQRSSAERGLAWLRTNQAADGALPGFAGGYTIGGTADGVFAIVAGGQDPTRWISKQGATPLTYLEERAAQNRVPSQGPDADPNIDPRDGADLAAKVAIAAAVSNRSPDQFRGANLIQFIGDHYEAAEGVYSGYYGPGPFAQSLAMLGLGAAGRAPPCKATEHLLSLQKADGGWEFAASYGSDTNTTALALQALVATTDSGGRKSDTGSADATAAIAAATKFFKQQQGDDGGFASQKAKAGNSCRGSRTSDANSTALAIQAIRAAGQDPKGPAWNKGGGPLPFLLSLQGRNGSFSYQEGSDCQDDAGATSAAIPAVAETSFVCLIGMGTCPPAPVLRRPGPVAIGGHRGVGYLAVLAGVAVIGLLSVSIIRRIGRLRH